LIEIKDLLRASGFYITLMEEWNDGILGVKAGHIFIKTEEYL
jgi:hypothetical protein